MKRPPRIDRFWASPPDREAQDLLRRIEQLDDLRQLVVLPDVHAASGSCVGAVVATDSWVYPEAVGSDIGCGMAALRFAGEATPLADARIAARLLAGLSAAVPIVSRRARDRVEALPLRPEFLSAPELRAVAQKDGLAQLGTLGRGNHFVEFQADEEDQFWVMLHSGSRGLGQAVHRHHLSRAMARPGAPLRGFAAESEAGRAYLADQVWAHAYAVWNRHHLLKAVQRVVGDVLGHEPEVASLITVSHNHVGWEWHEGQRLLVHRKGAQGLAAGQLGVIPGSMGSASFHVAGRGHAAALNSASHGAGRSLARGAARRQISLGQLEREMQGVWFDHRKAERLRDEAPGAYKDIGEVLRAQRDLVRVVRRLKPLLSYKSG